MCALAESHKDIDLGKSAGATASIGNLLRKKANSPQDGPVADADPPAFCILHPAYSGILYSFLLCLFFASHLHKDIALAEIWLVERGFFLLHLFIPLPSVME